MLNLDLAAKNRELVVEPFKNNLDIIVRRAQSEPVEQMSTDDVLKT